MSNLKCQIHASKNCLCEESMIMRDEAVLWLLKIRRGLLRSFVARNDKVSARGFTLVELVVVFTVMAVLTTTSIASFTAYNDSQTYRNAVADVLGSLNIARSRSLSQVKPDYCLTQALDGYQVTFSVPGQTYELDVVCSGQAYPIEKKSLPPHVTFANGSSSKIFFTVFQASVFNPGSITISGYGKNQMINVDITGTISVH